MTNSAKVNPIVMCGTCLRQPSFVYVIVLFHKYKNNLLGSRLLFLWLIFSRALSIGVSSLAKLPGHYVCGTTMVVLISFLFGCQERSFVLLAIDGRLIFESIVCSFKGISTRVLPVFQGPLATSVCHTSPWGIIGSSISGPVPLSIESNLDGVLLCRGRVHCCCNGILGLFTVCPYSTENTPP